ncbi:caspase, EACC1-associated type [Nostoc sp. UHCC 0870]|uniref:caspase, EACC1-associated type n=1 Tax=Nostoc sp. UHCC 0870 TaxID=2914041 RepID=UPI001EE0E453|nr:SUMF1/EgtB/PvdO family nonheme iron enzyme [Nostoc sp. UHCC 0870]UKO99518.1 SUMF1/EgtB/PvdO family nonheme iron enzyme [Nostoc sp. UHCC 0870]
MAKFALLIGVSEYKADLKAIPSAVRDVEALKQVLINPDMGEFPESNVTVLPNPNRMDMEIAIDKIFTGRKTYDLVLFYFSGHGLKDERRKLYLSTSETILDNGRLVPPTAVEARYLHDRMNASKSKQQVIILDSCFSGAFAEGLNAKSAGIVDSVDIIAEELHSEGRAILTSSTSTEYSFEKAGSDLSIYTRYLVEGITNGAADQDGDGNISVDELHNYASGKVREVSPAMTPQFYPVKEGYKIWLAKAPVNDPKLMYRKEVELRVNHGKISKVARRLLNSKQTQLSLLPEEAAAIEFEVLQPYREFQRKLEEYEQALLEAVEEGYPDDEIVSNDLQAYQHDLGLRDENIKPIHQRLRIPMKNTSPPTGSQTPPFPSREGGMGGLGQFQFDIVTVNAKGKETSRSQGQAKYFTADLGNGVTLDMVSIPGGEFLMGSPDKELEQSDTESPQHQVKVQPFFMGKFPVTQAQWRAVASLPKVNHDLESDPSNFKGVNRPVEMVSWFHAVEFCQRLSQKLGREYRLPTEAEWEYACRAGTTTPFHFGETISTDLVNYDGDYVYGSGAKGKYRKETTDVGSFGVANAFGLYDMHGLVWEWCFDHWHENYQGAPTDGSAWLIEGKENDNHYRLLRGGSWHYNPRYCRCAYRLRYEPDYWNYYIGLRVVCSPARTP